MKRLLIALAALMLLVPGCSRVYEFTGIIVDGSGNPISNAVVSVWPVTFETTPCEAEPQNVSNANCDETGAFSLGWCCAVGVEFFRMKVTADGFKDDFRIVEADAKDLRIVLERIERE